MPGCVLPSWHRWQSRVRVAADKNSPRPIQSTAHGCAHDGVLRATCPFTPALVTDPGPIALASPAWHALRTRSAHLFSRCYDREYVTAYKGRHRSANSSPRRCAETYALNSVSL